MREVLTGKLRDGCLNVSESETHELAREKIDGRRVDYDERRPHDAVTRLIWSEDDRSGHDNDARERPIFC